MHRGQDIVAKVAILFYSRTGNTKKIAELLNDRLRQHEIETDLIEIEVEGKVNFRRIGKMSKDIADIPLLNPDYSLSGYDLIVIGTPVWTGNPALPCLSYLQRLEKNGEKRIALFLTGMRATRKNENVMDALEKELSKLGYDNIIARLILKFRRSKLVGGEESILEFVDSLIHIDDS
jgi:NAD(P)H dehydrogenase (quinone)